MTAYTDGQKVALTGQRQIYVVRDEDGVVLYVGCTQLLRHRLNCLRTRAAWWPTKADVRSYWVPDSRAADEELAAIRALKPRHNRAGVTIAYVPPHDLVKRARARPHAAHVESVLADLLSMVEVAELTGKTRRTIQRWVAAGQLAPVKQLPGSKGALLFARADVEKVIAEDKAS